MSPVASQLAELAATAAQHLIEDRVNDAVTAYTRGIDIASGSSDPATAALLADLLVNRARCHAALELVKRSLKDTKSALELSPYHAATHVLEARIAVAHGQFNARKSYAGVEDFLQKKAQMVLDYEARREIQRLLEMVKAGRTLDVVVPTGAITLSSMNDTVKQQQQQPKQVPGPRSDPSSTQVASTTSPGVTSSAQTPVSPQVYTSPTTLKAPSGSNTAQPDSRTSQAAGLVATFGNAPPSSFSPASNNYASRPSAAVMQQQQERNQQQANAGAAPVGSQCLANITPGESFALKNKLEQAIQLINAKQCEKALAVLDPIMDKLYDFPPALATKGTAHAQLGDLQTAIGYLNKSLLYDPKNVDILMRRIYISLGLERLEDADRDLKAVVALGAPDTPDLLLQRGGVAQKLLRFQESINLFQKAVKMDPGRAQLWHMLAMSYCSSGYYVEGFECVDKAIELDKNVSEVYLVKAGLCREVGLMERGVEAAEQAIRANPRNSIARHMLGYIYHSAAMFDKAVEAMAGCLSVDPNYRDAYMLKAISEGNMGKYGQAAKTAQTLLEKRPTDFVLHHFEFMVWLAKNMTKEIFDKKTGKRVLTLDEELPMQFKEDFSRRTNTSSCAIYTNKMLMSPQMHSLPEPRNLVTMCPALKDLIRMADMIGRAIQLNTAGFMANRRQCRMCGLSMIQLVQQFDELRGRISNNEPNATRQWAHYVVHWRSLCETLDPVLWVDQLSEEMFMEGFGMSTPLMSGECRIVRYYLYWPRAMALMKKLLPVQYAMTDEMRARLAKAKNAEEVWQAMGRDHFVINHAVVEDWILKRITDKTMPWRLEGARFTIQRERQKPGVTALIRVPGSPERFAHFFLVLDVVMKEIVAFPKADSEAHRATFDIEAYVRLCLTYYYYWNAFQPLTRGSAACGLIQFFSLLLSQRLWLKHGWKLGTTPGNEFGRAGGGTIVDENDYSSFFMTNVQMDWIALLSTTLDQFLNDVLPWMLPRIGFLPGDDDIIAACYKKCNENLRAPGPVDQLPNLKDELATMEHYLAAIQAPH